MFNKGQVTAPFELLVAIIIMAFVLIVGSQMLGQVTDQVCMSHVEKEMSEFVTYLEDTSNNKSTSKFIFSPQSVCFDDDEHIMKIVRERDSKVCSSKCGIPQDTCYIMLFHTSDVALGYKERCINLPVYTNFAVDDSTCTTLDDLAGYMVINPSDKIPFGSYVLKNVARTGETWPNVCFYHKG